jgi:hypothetical protein
MSSGPPNKKTNNELVTLSALVWFGSDPFYTPSWLHCLFSHTMLVSRFFRYAPLLYTWTQKMISDYNSKHAELWWKLFLMLLTHNIQQNKQFWVNQKTKVFRKNFEILLIILAFFLKFFILIQNCKNLRQFENISNFSNHFWKLEKYFWHFPEIFILTQNIENISGKSKIDDVSNFSTNFWEFKKIFLAFFLKIFLQIQNNEWMMNFIKSRKVWNWSKKNVSREQKSFNVHVHLYRTKRNIFWWGCKCCLEISDGCEIIMQYLVLFRWVSTVVFPALPWCFFMLWCVRWAGWR